MRALRTEASFYGVDDMVNLIDEHLTSADRVIILSVGGVEYQVTANTLRHAPPHSILTALANDSHEFPRDHKVCSDILSSS